MDEQSVAGSIEVLIGSGETLQSYGIPVEAATPAEVPVVVKVRHGITGLAAVAEPEAVNGRVPVAAWEAVTDDGQPVAVRLWQALPLDETAIGQALAASLADAGPA